MFGSDANLGSFNLKSQVTIAGKLISRVYKPSSISLTTSNDFSLIFNFEEKVA